MIAGNLALAEGNHRLNGLILIKQIPDSIFMPVKAHRLNLYISRSWINPQCYTRLFVLIRDSSKHKIPQSMHCAASDVAYIKYTQLCLD